MGCMEVSPCTPQGDSPRHGTPQDEPCGETWLAAHAEPPGTARSSLLCPTSHGPAQNWLCLGVRKGPRGIASKCVLTSKALTTCGARHTPTSRKSL